jgi:hypothetical protein
MFFSYILFLFIIFVILFLKGICMMLNRLKEYGRKQAFKADDTVSGDIFTAIGEKTGLTNTVSNIVSAPINFVTGGIKKLFTPKETYMDKTKNAMISINKTLGLTDVAKSHVAEGAIEALGIKDSVKGLVKALTGRLLNFGNRNGNGLVK